MHPSRDEEDRRVLPLRHMVDGPRHGRLAPLVAEPPAPSRFFERNEDQLGERLVVAVTVRPAYQSLDSMSGTLDELRRTEPLYLDEDSPDREVNVQGTAERGEQVGEVGLGWARLHEDRLHDAGGILSVFVVGALVTEHGGRARQRLFGVGPVHDIEYVAAERVCAAIVTTCRCTF